MLASCLACSFGDLALEWKRGARRVRFVVVSLDEIAVQNHVQNHNSNKKELLL